MTSSSLLLLFISLFLNSSCSSSSYFETLYVYKNLPDYMAINLRINGALYYPESQNVTYTGQNFTFPSTNKDYVEIIYTNFSAYAGSCQVFKNGYQVYGSTQNNFYIPNRCTFDNGCDFIVDSFGTYAQGVNLTISVNNKPRISNFTAGSQTISIKKDDSIHVQISKAVSGNFGANFTTVTDTGNTISTWYNRYFTSQVLLENAYYDLPVSNASFYESTNVPIRIGSLPDTNYYNVSMYCNDTLINSKLVPSNNQTTQSFPILTGLAGKSCYLKLADSTYTYDKLTVTVESQSPSNITFAPLASKNYYAGSNVSVALLSSPEAGSFMVKLTCPNFEPVTQLISSNTTAQNFTIPDYFYGGNCTFNVNYPIASTNTPTINVIIIGNLTMNAPQNGTRIAAGTKAEIVITTNPPIDISVTVELDCGDDMQTTAPFNTNSSSIQYFPVPRSFYGAFCIFRFKNYPPFLIPSDPVNVTITQNLIFTSPSEGSIVYRPDQIPILMTPGYADIVNLVTLQLNCTDSATIDAYTDVLLNYEYTNQLYGNCELSVKEAPEYFVIPSSLHFSLKDQLFFAQVPSFIVNDLSFSVQIDTFSTPIPGHNTVDLELHCNGINEVLGWTDIPLNEPTFIFLNDPVFISGPYKCYFRVAPNEVYEGITSNVQVLTQLTQDELEQFIFRCGLDSNSLWISISGVV